MLKSPSGVPESSSKYEEYRTKCIQLLNELINPCSKMDEPKTPGSNDSKIDTKGSAPDTKGSAPTEQKSSTVLKHDGQVGSLEDLIVFLIKAPLKNDDLRMKLNDVYKIFNPNARDIVSKKINSPSAPGPVPGPGPSPAPGPVPGNKSRDEQISLFNKEYTDSKDKLNDSTLVNKPFYNEGQSPKNILSKFETLCMKLINDLTGQNNDIFTKYPELLKAKQDAHIKIPDTLYTDKVKIKFLDYLDKWKQIVDKIIEETKPKPSA